MAEHGMFLQLLLYTAMSAGVVCTTLETIQPTATEDLRGVTRKLSSSLLCQCFLHICLYVPTFKELTSDLASSKQTYADYQTESCDMWSMALSLTLVQLVIVSIPEK